MLDIHYAPKADNRANIVSVCGDLVRQEYGPALTSKRAEATCQHCLRETARKP